MHFRVVHLTLCEFHQGLFFIFYFKEIKTKVAKEILRKWAVALEPKREVPIGRGDVSLGRSVTRGPHWPALLVRPRGN